MGEYGPSVGEETVEKKNKDLLTELENQINSAVTEGNSNEQMLADAAIRKIRQWREDYKKFPPAETVTSIKLDFLNAIPHEGRDIRPSREFMERILQNTGAMKQGETLEEFENPDSSYPTRKANALQTKLPRAAVIGGAKLFTQIAGESELDRSRGSYDMTAQTINDLRTSSDKLTFDVYVKGAYGKFIEGKVSLATLKELTAQK